MHKDLVDRLEEVELGHLVHSLVVDIVVVVDNNHMVVVGRLVMVEDIVVEDIPVVDNFVVVGTVVVGMVAVGQEELCLLYFSSSLS